MSMSIATAPTTETMPAPATTAPEAFLACFKISKELMGGRISTPSSS